MLDDEDLSGGDFVRNVKQLIDLLRQIGDVAPQPGTAAVARQAADRLFRGIVAASSAIGQGGGADDLDEGALEAVGSPPGDDDDTSATG